MAIALLDILQAVPLFRRRLQRFGQHHDLIGIHRDLAAFGATHLAAHADDVAQVQRLHDRGETALHVFLAGVDLQLHSVVDQVDEHAAVADRHHAAGHGHAFRGFFLGLKMRELLVYRGILV